MSVRVMGWAWDQADTPGRKLLLLALADEARDTGWCWRDQAALARKTGLALDTVREYLRTLERSGLLVRFRRRWPDSGRQRHSAYLLLTGEVDPDEIVAARPDGVDEADVRVALETHDPPGSQPRRSTGAPAPPDPLPATGAPAPPVHRGSDPASTGAPAPPIKESREHEPLAPPPTPSTTRDDSSVGAGGGGGSADADETWREIRGRLTDRDRIRLAASGRNVRQQMHDAIARRLAEGWRPGLLAEVVTTGHLDDAVNVAAVLLHRVSSLAGVEPFDRTPASPQAWAVRLGEQWAATVAVGVFTAADAESGLRAEAERLPERELVGAALAAFSRALALAEGVTA